MFKWIGRGKRLEQKLDEVLGYYNRPVAGSVGKSRPPQEESSIILMTDEREERIRDEAREEG